MASQDKLSTASALLQQLTLVLPKDINFDIYHLSTPPTKSSALYSALPGTRPDKTYCESHFLSASIQTPSVESSSKSATILVFAIEILVYSTAYDTTFFISKADSTGYLHLLNYAKRTPSPLREISAVFLKHLVEKRHRPNKRSVVSLFARAQDQYLFPGSIEYAGKHVLDDRGLIRWWCRVLDPLISNSGTAEASQTSRWKSIEGYLTVPGLDIHETKSYIPKGTQATWIVGHPLEKISRHGGRAPPRCLIPHFPDDPKSRYLDELDEEVSKARDDGDREWKSVKSIDQFWEMMAFRQECSAGRLVGFIWVVFTAMAHGQDEAKSEDDSRSNAIKSEVNSSILLEPSESSHLLTPTASFIGHGQHPTKRPPLKAAPGPLSPAQVDSIRPSKSHSPAKKPRLCGPIKPREPRIKTENKNRSLESAEESAYYSWRQEGRGQVVMEEPDYKRVTELLLRLDFANLDLAASSSIRWINEVRSGATTDMRGLWGQTVTGSRAMETIPNTSVGVNSLSLNLVRKKRKVDTVEEPTKLLDNVPNVNVLSAGTIRKKAKV